MTKEVVPGWITKLAVGALVTALIGGAIGWVSHTSAQVDRMDKVQAVQEAEQKHIKDDIVDIKNSQRRVEDKLDKALERRQ